MFNDLQAIHTEQQLYNRLQHWDQLCTDIVSFRKNHIKDGFMSIFDHDFFIKIKMHEDTTCCYSCAMFIFYKINHIIAQHRNLIAYHTFHTIPQHRIALHTIPQNDSFKKYLLILYTIVLIIFLQYHFLDLISDLFLSLKKNYSVVLP